MTIHRIQYPDLMRGRELRTIIWDDVAGAVDGDHSRISYIRKVIEETKKGPVNVSCIPVGVLVTDPAHYPKDFLTVLGRYGFKISPRAVLPEPLRGITPHQPDFEAARRDSPTGILF